MPHLFFMDHKEILEGEEFRQIVGAPNYLVSNFGRIYSPRRRKAKGVFRKIQTNLSGYKHVGLTKDGKFRTVTIHRLVALTFLDNPDNHPLINHKDGDKANNFASNLEWCSQSHNHRHSLRMGLYVPPKNEDHWNSRLKESDVHEIRARISDGEMLKMIAKHFGVSHSAISGIKNGRTWRNIK